MDTKTKQETICPICNNPDDVLVGYDRPYPFDNKHYYETYQQGRENNNIGLHCYSRLMHRLFIDFICSKTQTELKDLLVFCKLYFIEHTISHIKELSEGCIEKSFETNLIINNPFASTPKPIIQFSIFYDKDRNSSSVFWSNSRMGDDKIEKFLNLIIEHIKAFQ